MNGKRLKEERKHSPLLTNLWDHAFKGLHDLGALRFLVVGENTSNYDDAGQHKTQVQLGNSRPQVPIVRRQNDNRFETV